jgi:hypothetical protein
MGLSPSAAAAAADAASTALLCVTGSQRSTMSCSLRCWQEMGDTQHTAQAVRVQPTH